jgi:hypothetical protein
MGGWCDRVVAEWGRTATRQWSGIAVLKSSGWPSANGVFNVADVWVYLAPADLPQSIRGLLAADAEPVKDQCTIL